MKIKKTAILIAVFAFMLSAASCGEAEESSSYQPEADRSSVIDDTSTESSSSEDGSQISEYAVAFNVADEDGNAVSGATVAIGKLSGKTDDVGSCNISLEPGEYGFSVSCEGYESYGSMFVLSDKAIKIEVQLTLAVASEDLYKETLDMYYDAITEGWPNGAEGWYPDSGIYGGATYLWGYEPERGLADIGYQLIDLNGDGTDELIVSPIFDADQGYDVSMIYDLYTLKDGKTVHLVASGERDRYYLCEDNTLYNEGSSSALESSFMSFSVSDDASLVLNEVYLYDGWEDEQHPWFYATGDVFGGSDEYYDANKMQRITEEEFYKGIDSYKYAPLKLTPFIEYSR